MVVSWRGHMARHGGRGGARTARFTLVVVALIASSLAGIGALRPLSAGATTGLQGVDVYSGSGTINWGDVGRAGYSFGYARATEGNYLEDDEFQTNWAGMVASGLTPGAISTVDPAVDGVEQASYFFNFVGSDYRSKDLLPAVDTSIIGADLSPTCKSGQPYPVQCVTEATALSVLSAVVSTLQNDFGEAPVIYTTPSIWDGLLGDPAGYGADPLWDVQLGTTAPTSASLPANDWYGDSWALWQYSLSGTVPGISVTSDVDQSNGSELPTLTKFPLSITTTLLPSGQVGDPYSDSLAALGGNPPYTWKLVKGSGMLPEGLKLHETRGVISGTPEQSGSSTFTVEVMGTKAKPKDTDTAKFTIAVSPAA
jgi:GH25 family lysozyme M1 (1,4-beta-N-acetylmuramidase)